MQVRLCLLPQAREGHFLPDLKDEVSKSLPNPPEIL